LIGVTRDPLHRDKMRRPARRPLGLVIEAAHAPTSMQQGKGNLAAMAPSTRVILLLVNLAHSRFEFRCPQSGAWWIKQIVES
jgi:hypothetical protein